MIDTEKLISVLAGTDGNISRTAQEMSISRTTVYTQLQDPDVMDAYNKARLTILSDSMDAFRTYRENAIETLYEIIIDPKEKTPNRIRACDVMLTQSRLAELMMLELEKTLRKNAKEDADNMLTASLMKSISSQISP